MATLAPATPKGDAVASDRILRAATGLFCERGYHGTSVRTLARVLRLETASLYYHFPSKQEILFAILDRTLDDLLDGLRRAGAAAAGAEQRLRAAGRHHGLFHAHPRQGGVRRHSEVRSPPPGNLGRVVAKRDPDEDVFRGPRTPGV